MIRPSAVAVKVAVASLALSVAAMAASVWLWDVTAAPPGCDRPGTVCLGAVVSRPHAVLSFLLGLVSVGALAVAVAAVVALRTRRPVVIGGWRHPIDAAGVRFSELPYWRRVAIGVLAFPLVAWIFVIYQVRRLLLGPPAPR